MWSCCEWGGAIVILALPFFSTTTKKPSPSSSIPFIVPRRTPLSQSSQHIQTHSYTRVETWTRNLELSSSARYRSGNHTHEKWRRLCLLGWIWTSESKERWSFGKMCVYHHETNSSNDASLYFDYSFHFHYHQGNTMGKKNIKCNNKLDFDSCWRGNFLKSRFFAYLGIFPHDIFSLGKSVRRRTADAE